MVRLVCRILILAGCVYMYFAQPQQLSVLKPGSFLNRFSWLHLLWGVWMVDMLQQLHPAKCNLALGSKKNFREYFKPVREAIDLKALKRYIISTTKAAYKIFLVWALLILGLGFLYLQGIMDEGMLFLVSAAFYVCDLICVLIWCPFRLFLKNRCCTTCRIFNWDHVMMFTPMLFINSFYARSLLVVSLVVWCAWELSVLLYPERFWALSNENLQCSQCTDKLCTQYCQKLRTEKKAFSD